MTRLFFLLAALAAWPSFVSGNDGASSNLTFTAPAFTAPAVTTDLPLYIDLGGVGLGGSINPNGIPTTGWFEYGLTPSLGTATPEFDAGSGNLAGSHTLKIIVTPGVTYYYRLSARNWGGTTHGEIRSAQYPILTMPEVEAVDDQAFTAGRNAVVVNVLANDTGPSLEIMEATRPTSGSVVINPSGSLTYSPSASFEGIDTFTYRVRSQTTGVTGVATVVVRHTYAACTGSYNALVGTSLTRAANAGSITLLATPLGSFTGVLQFAGDTFPLKGQLRFDGQGFVDLKNRRSQPITLNFTIDPADAKLSGGVTISGVTSQFESGKVIYDSVQNFAPQAGRYTLLLPRTESNEPSFRGDGFATMTINSAGAVALTGRTGEGVPFSAKGLVGPDSTFPLYAPIGSKRRSSLQGWVKFRNQPGISDCDGTIGFDQPFELVFSSTQSSSGVTIIVVGEPPDPIQTLLVGSRYITPAPGTLLLDWQDQTPNGSFETGSSQSQIGILPVTLNSKHKIKGSGSGAFTLKLDAKTGLFSGTVKLSLSPKPKLGTFHGVLFQRQAVGGGFWKAGADIGWISIAPINAE